eukprot:92303-Chlamydomonas_euryale.AAC.1
MDTPADPRIYIQDIYMIQDIYPGYIYGWARRAEPRRHRQEAQPVALRCASGRAASLPVSTALAVAAGGRPACCLAIWVFQTLRAGFLVGSRFSGLGFRVWGLGCLVGSRFIGGPRARLPEWVLASRMAEGWGPGHPRGAAHKAVVCFWPGAAHRA